MANDLTKGQSDPTLYDKDGKLAGFPKNMLGDSSEYSAEVRKDLEQYGQLVNDGNPELEEYFKRVIEN